MESLEARRTIADLIVALEVANEDEFSHEWKAIAGAALVELYDTLWHLRAIPLFRDHVSKWMAAPEELMVGSRPEVTNLDECFAVQRERVERFVNEAMRNWRPQNDALQGSGNRSENDEQEPLPTLRLVYSNTSGALR